MFLLNRAGHFAYTLSDFFVLFVINRQHDKARATMIRRRFNNLQQRATVAHKLAVPALQPHFANAMRSALTAGLFRTTVVVSNSRLLWLYLIGCRYSRVYGISYHLNYFTLHESNRRTRVDASIIIDSNVTAYTALNV